MTTTSGPDGTVYVPVIDVSRHQGSIDFQIMKASGVEGLIFRSNHANIVDDRCAGYVKAARAAGWRDDQLGFYTFCNPKRASGWHSGVVFVDTVRAIFGRTDTLLMLDLEGYVNESGAGPVLKGAAFAAWIRDHIRAVISLAPGCRLIAYSNASFWNPWVGDQALADSLEWIVPRYPIYSLGGYAGNPVPAPGGWAGWAWRVGPKGPIAPSGATWAGWQFSAGYNRQGPVYGCQSSDLDLNIVELSAWQRWTGIGLPPPPPVVVQPGTDVDEEEEPSVRIKINDTPDEPGDGAPNVWVERIGMDLHTVSSGRLFAKMPGAKADESDIARITTTEASWEVEAARYTYGEFTAAQLLRLAPAFVALWNSKREPVGGGGSGGEQLVRVQVDVTGP